MKTNTTTTTTVNKQKTDMDSARPGENLIKDQITKREAMQEQIGKLEPGIREEVQAVFNSI